MCGRYAIFGPVSRNNREALAFLERELEFAPTWNAAPTQLLPVLSIGRNGERELRLMRWGLVPYWAKNAAIGAKLINARADALDEKPAFRSAFERRRCLIPMSGFYEWKKSPVVQLATRGAAGGDGKGSFLPLSKGPVSRPYYVHPLNSDLFAVAGLREYWPGRDGAGPIESYTVITTDANELMRNVHDRMPAILQESDYDAWLDPKGADPVRLKGLLKPFPAEEMRAYPVSARVSNANNNGPELIAPAADGQPSADLFSQS